MTKWREGIIWAAGLFEGEGYVGLCSNRRQGRLALASTDLDVLQRFHSVIEFGSIGKSYQVQNRKPIWFWRKSGFESVQALAVMFWPWLGARRRMKFTQVLQSTRTVPVGKGKNPCSWNGHRGKRKDDSA